MMPDHDPQNGSKSPLPRESCDKSFDDHHQRAGAFSMIKRDRFELLSAYLDGEVTASERKQVEEWLESDPVVQRLYARLLQLRQGIQTMPVPAPTESVEKTVEKVLQRVDRRPKLSLIFGGAAVAAAVVVGAIASLLSGDNSFSPQFAESPNTPSSVEQAQLPNTAQPKVSSEALMIALDQPVVQIPKAPVSVPAESLDTLYNDSNADIR
jgi:anti-sigma factor RsiW